MERVILVGVREKGDSAKVQEYSLEELRRLTETAGGSVAGVLTQALERFNPRSLIGEGKVDEVAAAARAAGARTVVFDEELSPAQQIHLEETMKAKVVDRTRLILDIFARRARTKEGELQVELAQLSYMLPRLTGSWRSYSQQVGGIGTRGPGERQLEYERRHIQRRIEHLRRAIARMEGERALQRRRRESIPVPTVAILGYTNVGKSSLLNRLVGAAPARARKTVYADDKLFATLDPTSRRVILPQGGWAVFTDTVGFISKLPTTLIAAFRSTLEEVARADCLLHLEDASSEDAARQRQTVETLLEDLGAEGLPRVRALTTADLLGTVARARARDLDPDASLVSVRTGEGIGELLAKVERSLSERWILRELTLDPARAGRLHEVYASAQVLSQAHPRGKIRLKLRVTPENWKRLLHRFSDAA